ncbi:hypothetical protein M1439_00720 [Candidatus Marsarchaeota archaeon]|nr:hypothetical protein [Candidatus Marsarchaeota archaeon]
MANFKSRRYNNEVQAFDVNSWEPVTLIGRMVKDRSVTSIEQIFSMGKNIEEVGIVEALLPGMKSEVIEIKSVQRMTRNNRKQKYRVTSIVGDSNGHVGVGIAKDVEVKAAIESSIKTCENEHNAHNIRMRIVAVHMRQRPQPSVYGSRKMRKRGGNTQACA